MKIQPLRIIISVHTGACARWYIYTETDRNGYDSATCCIKNVESGKMLNVPGNSGHKGNNLIQYHEDGTQAEVFVIENVGDGEVSGAVWTRDWTDVFSWWGMAEDTPENRDKYYTPINQYSGGYISYPRGMDKSMGYLATVLWLDDSMQEKLIQLHYPPSDGWTKVKQAAEDAVKDQIVDYLFQKLHGLGAFPFATVEGILSTYMVVQDENQWYEMERIFKDYTYCRIEIYYMFDSGNWGVICKGIVNNEIDPYWDGTRAAINKETTWVNMNNSGKLVKGSTEFFFQ